MKKVLYLSNAVFPNDAAGLRINHIADLLIANNVAVDFISTSFSSDLSFVKKDRIINYSKKSFIYLENGKRYFLPYRKGNRITKYIKGVLDVFFSIFSFSRVKEYIKKFHPDVVVLYNDFGPLTKKTLSLCRKNGILIYQDCTEWYEKKLNPKNYIEKCIPKMVDIRIRNIDKELDGTIAISQYLFDFYNNLGVRCYRLPPLMTLNNQTSFVKNNRFTIVYAGSAGEKDLISPLVEAVHFLLEENYNIRLIIIGKGFVKERENQFISYVGKIPHKQVIDVLQRADLSVLLRENKRYAKAGYSTKFAECMSLGIPMLCTAVGGCDLDVVHGNNGFLISDNSVESIKESLKEIIFKYERNYDEYVRIRKACLETANNLYNPASYAESLKSFLNL